MATLDKNSSLWLPLQRRPSLLAHDPLAHLIPLSAAILAWRLWRGRPWVQGALLMITVVMGLWWYSRAKLPYNSEGRWHDEEAMLVYDKGTEEVLRIGFMLCFAAWTDSMVGTAKHERG